jgi:hypothetical protein
MSLHRKIILFCGVILTVAVLTVFLMRPPAPGGTNRFSVTPDPTEKLLAALETNRPVFINFYSSR